MNTAGYAVIMASVNEIRKLIAKVSRLEARIDALTAPQEIVNPTDDYSHIEDALERVLDRRDERKAAAEQLHTELVARAHSNSTTAAHAEAVLKSAYEFFKARTGQK